MGYTLKDPLRQTDTPADRHAGRQTRRQTDTPADRYCGRQLHWPTGAEKQDRSRMAGWDRNAVRIEEKEG